MFCNFLAGAKEVKILSAWQLTKNLLAEKGIIGLYKGMGATAFRDITFSVVYFPLFAILSKLGKKPGEITPPFW